MTVSELRRLISDLDDSALVLTSGVAIAQAVLTEDRCLILEMDPEYQHDGTIVWRGLNS